MLTGHALRGLRLLSAHEPHAARACQRFLATDGGSSSTGGQQPEEVESTASSSDAQSFHFVLNPDLDHRGGVRDGQQPAEPSTSARAAPEEPMQQHTYLQPARLLDIASDARPHFRMPTKRRPDPVPVGDIWTAVRAASKLRTDESVDVSISLSIDPRKSDQVRRAAPPGPSTSMRALALRHPPATLADGVTVSERVSLCDLTQSPA